MRKNVVVDKDGHEAYRANGCLTASAVIVCIVAASAGLMFGYDVGLSGGVTTMEAFLKKFFPSVVKKMADAKQDQYCIFDSRMLTASLYIAGLFGSLVAGFVAISAGLKATLLVSGLCLLVGSAVNVCALNVPMLLLGRIFVGFGIGFGNQAAPAYVSELPPSPPPPPQQNGAAHSTQPCSSSSASAWWWPV